MVDYQRMSSEHETVLADLDRIELLANSPPEQLAPERRDELLRNDLAALEQSLTRHFAFEEEDGYLTVVTEVMPNLTPKVEALHKQHDAIRRLLHAATTEGSPESTDVANTAREIIRLLRNHEAAESGLVRKIINLDVAAPD